MSTKSATITIIVMLILSFLVALVLYPSMPDRCPRIGTPLARSTVT